MKNYTDKEIKEILLKHNKWLSGERDGECADLRSANLCSADLRSANLCYADLSSANLTYADLSSADLSYADLSSADLSYADLSHADLSYAKLGKTLLEGINWLAWIGITPINGKARAYKIIKQTGEGIFNGGINYLTGKELTENDLNRDVRLDCGAGINLATFQWCLNAKQDDTQKLILMEFEVNDDNVVCPIASDGKFRVKHCIKIGECDWKGNLKLQKRERNGRFAKS